MECNIVKDLIPLYIDSCCSKESFLAVEDHIVHCASCKRLYESMNTPCGTPQVPSAPTTVSKLLGWKASILQSLLLFASFALITVGVALEARTPTGPSNGNWAVSLIIPATGLLLSLANWYFVKLYRSRKLFSNCSFLCTLGCTICAYIWSVCHYTADAVSAMTLPYGIGIFLTSLFCILSKTLSNQYAKMLGKE